MSSHQLESDVYRTLHLVFTNDRATWRKNRSVKRLIEEQCCYPEVAALVSNYSLATVCAVTRRLLAENIFGSPTLARRRFSEVFQALDAHQHAILRGGTMAMQHFSGSPDNTQIQRRTTSKGKANRARRRRQRDRARDRDLAQPRTLAQARAAATRNPNAPIRETSQKGRRRFPCNETVLRGD